MRLDTVCFNLGFASTIVSARQQVNHGHITVNGNIVTIASFQCRIGDSISVKDKTISQNLIKKNLEQNKPLNIPSHLKLDEKKLEGIVLNYCDRNDLSVELNELLVIEYYSRR